MFSNPMQNIEYLDVHPGHTVLDVGSGAGEYVFALALRVGTTGRVYACDVQDMLLERIEREGHDRGFFNITPLHCDIDQPKGLSKLADASMDRILLANVIFQCDTPHHVFAECLRVLKPEGKLLLIDWKDSYGGLGPSVDRIIHPDRARHLLGQAGFVITSSSPDVGDHHYGLVCQKSGV